VVVDIPDVITCFKFGDDRFRGLASAEGQILPFPIDFDGRPYNTLTLLYDCMSVWWFSNLFQIPSRSLERHSTLVSRWDLTLKPYLTELLQYHKPARSTRVSASHSLSVPRHKVTTFHLVLALSASLRPKYGTPYLFTSANPKHTLPSDVILRRTTFFRPILPPSERPL